MAKLRGLVDDGAWDRAERVRLEHLIRNTAGKLDVIAVIAGAHGASEAQTRLHGIATMLRERVGNNEQGTMRRDK